MAGTSPAMTWISRWPCCLRQILHMLYVPQHPRFRRSGENHTKPALALAFDRDLDEERPVGRDGLRQRRRNVVGLVDPDTLDAHAGGQVHEVERRSGQVHLLIGMLGAGLELLAPDVGVVLE